MEEVKIAKDCIAAGVELKAGDVALLAPNVAEKLRARGFIVKPSSSKKEKANG